MFSRHLVAGLKMSWTPEASHGGGNRCHRCVHRRFGNKGVGLLLEWPSGHDPYSPRDINRHSCLIVMLWKSRHSKINDAGTDGVSLAATTTLTR
jgi:hypothetical protein